jgi:hypothetical protein
MDRREHPGKFPAGNMQNLTIEVLKSRGWEITAIKGVQFLDAPILGYW